MLLGFVWIAGAIWNAVVTLPDAADAWDVLGENATFGVYRWFFNSVVSAAPEFWSMMLIAGELVLGILLMAKGRWAQYGLAGSVLWSIFLTFLIFPYTLMMPLFVLLAAWLLRFEPRASVLDLLPHHHGDVRMS